MEILAPIKSLLLSDGFSIPQLALGTYTIQSNIILNEVIPHAYSLGYRHFDSAVMYNNEDLLGKVFKTHKIPRETLFLTSKILPTDMTYDRAIAATKNSLKELGTEYLDLLLIHWPGDKKNRIETWKACEYMKDCGMAKSIGVSNFTPVHLRSIFKDCKYMPVVNQIEIHPLYYDKETIEFCQKEKIILEAYCPFAQNDKKLIKNKTIMNLAEKYNKNVYQIILKWGLSQGFVMLPRSSKKTHVGENLQISDFELDAKEIQEITELNCDYKIDWDPHGIIN